MQTSNEDALSWPSDHHNSFDSCCHKNLSTRSNTANNNYKKKQQKIAREKNDTYRIETTILYQEH